jgi:FAD/FMN-containing dehydrogenase
METSGAGAGFFTVRLLRRHAATLRATFGAKYERPRRIKTTYDPDNVFRRNANITPVGT